MFWGIHLTQNDPVVINDDGALYITKAVLVDQKKGLNVIELELNQNSIQIAHLEFGKQEQCNLKYVLDDYKILKFTLKGPGKVNLIGYKVGSVEILDKDEEQQEIIKSKVSVAEMLKKQTEFPKLGENKQKVVEPIIREKKWDELDWSDEEMIKQHDLQLKKMNNLKKSKKIKKSK